MEPKHTSWEDIPEEDRDWISPEAADELLERSGDSSDSAVTHQEMMQRLGLAG